jgi:hypothetical protein
VSRGRLFRPMALSRVKELRLADAKLVDLYTAEIDLGGISRNTHQLRNPPSPRLRGRGCYRGQATYERRPLFFGLGSSAPRS